MTASASGNPLISRERSQKLELLNHLIANLAHTIVVCGPEGVGKTLLLRKFQETTKEPWIFCWLPCDSQLDLEKIQDLISASVAQVLPDLKSLALANVFERIATYKNKIVLVLDDAGKLPPGLIEKVISYAERKPVLRVIITLTHSEIYLKNGTDPAIDDCYQIDIPPLSEKQCSDFLEYLSTLQNPRIQFSAINESLVAALYRETHGIPGNILAHLPAPDDGKKPDYSKTILIYAVAGLIVLALGVQWWSSRPKKAVPETTATVTQPKTSSSIQQPVVKSAVTAQVNQPQAIPQPPATPVPQPVQNPVEPLSNNPATGVRNDVISDSHNQATIEEGLKHDVTQLPAQNPAPVAVENPSPPQTNAKEQIIEAAVVPAQAPAQVKPIAAIPQDEGGRWLIGQPAENITLQLMALSSEQAIVEVIQRHPDLEQNLKYLRTKTRSGRDRFVLLYGSFLTPDQAHLEGKNLPKEFQKPWMRKIGVVQAEINTAIPTDTPD